MKGEEEVEEVVVLTRTDARGMTRPGEKVAPQIFLRLKVVGRNRPI